VSRGDMLVHPGDLPRVARTFDAHLVWMHDAPLDLRRTYLLKHTTQVVRADVDRIHWRKDMDTLEEVAAATLGLNDIGRVTVTVHRALYLDPYAASRETGSFILVDALTNDTVGAGMVIDVGGDAGPALRAGVPAGGRDPVDADGGGSRVSAKARRQRFGASAGVVLLFETPGESTSALAYAIEARLFDIGASGVVFRPRNVGSGLSAARAIVDAGLLAIIPTRFTVFDEAVVEAQLEGRRLIVVRAARAGSPDAGPSPRGGAAGRTTIDVVADSVDEQAKAVVAELTERGWVG
jgi:bifunctional enzyme CysN/CysC